MSAQTNAYCAQKTFSQPYRNLKIQCLRSGKLFVDEKFPALDRSLFFMNNNSRQSTVKWIRAKDLSNNAELFADVYSKDDFNNKTLGISFKKYKIFICRSLSYFMLVLGKYDFLDGDLNIFKSNNQ